jgi:hypothetical protein
VSPSDAFLTYASHLLSGHVNPEDLQSEWFIKGRKRDFLMVLETALVQDSVEEALVSLKPPHPGYERLIVLRSGNLNWHGNSGFAVAFCCKRQISLLMFVELFRGKRHQIGRLDCGYFLVRHQPKLLFSCSP